MANKPTNPHDDDLESVLKRATSLLKILILPFIQAEHLAKIGGKLFSNNGSNTKDGGRGKRIEKGRGYRN